MYPQWSISDPAEQKITTQPFVQLDYSINNGFVSQYF